MATASQSVLDAKLSRSPGKLGILIFGAVLLVGVLYAGSSLLRDLSTVHSESILPYVLLGIALLVALGFEFVNGFHDTANAVATVIYTHSLEPHIAVVWSGFWNFLGVLTSSGLVAFGIISLLPVELILQVGSKAGFAMVFALLVAAIIWNLGTWYFGLPASSSHTLIGSVIWCRHRQPADLRTERHKRRGLGTGQKYRLVSLAVSDRRIHRCLSAVVIGEGADQR
jgi:PiT family inorganic phosphate transporter